MSLSTEKFLKCTKQFKKNIATYTIIEKCTFKYVQQSSWNKFVCRNGFHLFYGLLMTFYEWFATLLIAKKNMFKSQIPCLTLFCYLLILKVNNALLNMNYNIIKTVVI